MENTKNNRGGVYENGCISPSEEKEQLTFIDFFAGVGGFRRGLELAGWKCVGFCEFDKYATASYTSMHLITEEQRKYLETLPLKKRQKEILKDEYRNGEWYVSDIRDANARNLPKSDCWCFGAPCQDFSVAGKRAGLDGDRSSLIREIFRLLEEQEEQDRPEWLIYENVKGMLSSNRGLDYLSILSEMDRLGYDIEWQNINSKWFVPQNRERIYTIGHLRRCGSRKVLPITGADGENSILQIGKREAKRNNPNANRVYSVAGLGPCLSTMQGGGREPNIAVKVLGNTNPSGHGMNGNVYDSESIGPTLTTNKGEGNKIAIPVLTPDRVNKRQNGRRFKEDGEPMFTLTAQDRHGVGIEVCGFNTMPDGTIRTLKHQYQKNSAANFMMQTSRGASAVCVKMSKDILFDLKSFSSKTRGKAERIGYVPTLDHNCNIGVAEKTNIDDKKEKGIYVEMSGGFLAYCVWYEKYQCYITIRKLTPKECFRLQGWTDDYFEKAAFVNSDSQLYKQAGNGVTVDVVKVIGERIVSSR